MTSQLDPPAFLTETLSNSVTESPGHIQVTLTFAQSLDGKIAGVGGKQLILSGKESMLMTHWMRTIHDAILVGIGTAVNDDPQLNTRHLPEGVDRKVHPLPQPIVLDTHLRLPTSCKLLRNHAAGTGKQPWVVAKSSSASPQETDEWTARRTALEEAGARVLVVDTSTDRIEVEALLDVLYAEGIRSLMVEGGAQVIDSFLARPSLVHRVIITIAPIFVGQAGVGYGIASVMPTTKLLKSEIFGQDVVTALCFIET